MLHLPVREAAWSIIIPCMKCGEPGPVKRRSASTSARGLIANSAVRPLLVCLFLAARREPNGDTCANVALKTSARGLCCGVLFERDHQGSGANEEEAGHQGGFPLIILDSRRSLRGDKSLFFMKTQEEKHFGEASVVGRGRRRVREGERSDEYERS